MVKGVARRINSYSRRQQITAGLGVIGTLIALGIFVAHPSFPTPDKLFIFAVLVGLIFNQAIQVVYRLGPFALLLFTYDSFRGVATHLNSRVNYHFMPDIDKIMFGALPTKTLQNWWWNGKVQWYDYILYLPYMLHFLFPFALAIAVWKFRESEYWRVITAYVGISFFAFLIFLVFPAAPPWMASDYHFIEPITRISSFVWGTLGIHDFPSVYNRVTPNPVAAVPSLHAAYSTMFALFVIKLFKSRWSYLSIIYPILIYTGTIYQGEHYAFDEIVGALLGVAGFYLSPGLSRYIGVQVRRVTGLRIVRKARLQYAESKLTR